MTLDGSASSDPDGDPITAYAWILIEQPQGSSAAIRDADRARAYLTPHVPGVYRVGLVVYARVASERAEFRLTISDECCKPIANAGADVDVALGGEVALDGTRSSDPRRHALTYAWRITQSPPGSQPTLQGADQPTAHLKPDPAKPHASYELGLVVTNSERLQSEEDRVAVTVRNSEPTISLGDNRLVVPGAQAQLTATATDADGDALQYTWRIVSQPGTGATLTQVEGHPNQALFGTEVGVLGDSVVECTVDDGHGARVAAQVTIAERNLPPTVRAGDDVRVGHQCDASGACSVTVSLGGMANDPEGDALTLEWDRVPVETPPVSDNDGLGEVVFRSTSTAATQATIRATDGVIKGQYKLRLRAKDALHDAQASTLVITVTNRAPAGDVTVSASEGHTSSPLPSGATQYEATFTLASNAQDPDYGGSDPSGQELTYLWTGPQPEEAADVDATGLVSNATNRTTTVKVRKICAVGSCSATPGFLGDYTFHVQVTDPNGAASSAPVKVTVTNRPPIVDLGPASRGVAPGSVVTLQANASDPDGDALAYRWELVPGTGGRLSPSGASATLTTSTELATHVVRATVTDAFGVSATATASIVTNPAPVVDPIARITLPHTCTVTAGVPSCSAQTTIVGSAHDADALHYEWRDLTAPVDRPLVTMGLSTPADASTRTLTLTSGVDGAISGLYTLRFCAKDPYNGAVCVPVEVLVKNQAPAGVSAGSNQTVNHRADPSGSKIYAASFNLAGTASDPDFAGVPLDQQTLRFAWSNPAPGELTFDASARAPTVTARKDCTVGCGSGVTRMGPYTFVLTVTDVNGATATASTTVTIANAAPTLTIAVSPTDALDGTTVTFTATGADADNDGLDTIWDVGGLPMGFATAQNGATLEVTTPKGTYGRWTISAQVSDGFTTSTPATAWLHVNAPPRATVPATPLTVGYHCDTDGFCSAEVLTLGGSVTDSDPGDVSYAEWSVVSAPSRSPAATIRFSSSSDPASGVAITGGALSGNYDFKLCAYDLLHTPGMTPASDQCRTRRLTITNLPPVARTEGAKMVAHQAVNGQENYQAKTTLIGSGEDPECSPPSCANPPRYLTYRWTVLSQADPNARVVFDDTGTSTTTKQSPSVSISRDCVSGTPACPPRPYPDGTVLLGDPTGGYYIFTLTVTDKEGATHSANVSVRVTNDGPLTPSPAWSYLSPVAHRFADALTTTFYDAAVQVGSSAVSEAANSDPLTYEWFLQSPAPNVCIVATHGSLSCLSSVSAPLSTTITLRGDANLITGGRSPHQVCIRPVDPWGIRPPPGTSYSCASVDVRNDAPAAPNAGFGTAGQTLSLQHTYGPDAAASGSVYSARVSITPSGASSDVEGDPVSYAWRLASTSPGVQLVAPAVSPTPQAGELRLVAANPSDLIRAPVHTICLVATDSLGASSSDCRDVVVGNRAPTPVSAGFQDRTTLSHTYNNGYSATIASVTAGAYADVDGDPMASYRWYVAGQSGITVTGPGPGSSSALTLTSATGTDLTSPSGLKVCLETRDSVGAVSQETSGTNCRSLFVTNRAPSASMVGFVAGTTIDHFFDGALLRYAASLVNVSPSAYADPDGDPGYSPAYRWYCSDDATISVVGPAPGAMGTLQLYTASDFAGSGGKQLVGTHTICLETRDALGLASSAASGVNCASLVVRNRVPAIGSVGFTNGTSVGHAFSGATQLYSATVIGVQPDAYQDPDQDPAGSPTYRWYVSNVSGVSVTGPAGGSAGTLTLSTSVGTNLTAQPLTVCLETKDVFGAVSPVGVGTNCRSLTVTNFAPAISAAGVTTPSGGTCGCATNRLTATVSGNGEGDPVTVTFAGTGGGTACGATTATCTLPSGSGTCTVDFTLSCTQGKSITWTATARDGAGGVSAAYSVGTTNVSCNPTSCGGVCGC